MSVYVGAGSRNEDLSTTGSAYLLQRMAERGNSSRSKTEISEAIIVQIELIEKTLKDNEPETIKLAILDLDKFYTDVIISYQTKLAKEEERLAEEKRKKKKD